MTCTPPLSETRSDREMERRGFPGSGARPRSAPGDALSPGCGGLCHVSPVSCSRPTCRPQRVLPAQSSGRPRPAVRRRELAGRTAGHAKVSRRLKPLAPCIRGRDEGQRQAKRQAGPPAPASSAASCTLDAFGTLACVTLTPGNVHSGSFFPVTPQSLPAALPRLADHRGHPQDT